MFPSLSAAVMSATSDHHEQQLIYYSRHNNFFNSICAFLYHSLEISGAGRLCGKREIARVDTQPSSIPQERNARIQ